LSKTPILLAHGLEGSPEGSKARALRGLGEPFACPDGRGLNLAQRIELLRPHLQDTEETLLVGSSYGGLVALYLASCLPTNVRGLLLCAPALHHREAPVLSLPELPPSIPCVLIHGLRDTDVPPQVSRELAARHPHIELLLVDDAHRLENSTELIVETARRLRGSAPQKAIEETLGHTER
jgi:pimeloyl-ACP methyl ester carboxylesterase